ncbi:hypothetical protein BCR39DRAFT_465791 [Naematelia encephala]|uniref:RRM domain-containing protein n=1 Tax=Naematelia encephala TaxID=71784 RepID=A0A1Y2B9H6_9TREE|nr:hypothetical protein BCR39DRAFT_465791 [Naematelia encephala]
MPCEIHTTPDRYHPSLRRVLMYTYKGRRLEERMVNGEPKYFDRAAVFVGRLVKEQETKETLFHRFRKYGAINDIEYNPTSCQATYATARVLYNMEDAAQRAISNEHEAVSFGSRIKVEPRKVLPLDVQVGTTPNHSTEKSQTREMFMDHLGRPVSPSMVSQYSPPSVPFQPQVPLPPPPPPLEPWTVPTLAPGPMMVPNAPAHLPLLLGGPLVPPPGNIETSSTAAQSPNIPSPPVQSGSVIPVS